MSEEKIEGSDGISRTIKEWETFILERVSLSNGDKTADIAGANFSLALREAWKCKKEGKVSLDISRSGDPTLEYSALKIVMGNAAKDCFMSFLEESVSENLSAVRERDIDDVIESFVSKIKLLLSRSKNAPATKKAQVAKAGNVILFYLMEKKSFPSSSQEVEDFSITIGDRIPRTTVTAALPWYHLEDII